MKHLVFTQCGTPSESVALHDDRDPVPGAGDVLVRMEAAAVNPSDLLLVRGLYFAKPEPPAPLGGEGVGIVVAAGAQADQSLLGKRVIVLPTYTHGTWAEKVVVPQDKVVEVASEADPLQLAMLSINPATAQALSRYTGATAASAATIHQKYAPTKPTNSTTPTSWASSLIGRQAHPRAARSRCIHRDNATHAFGARRPRQRRRWCAHSAARRTSSR